MWADEKMSHILKDHSVHMKINDEQFEYLSTKGNKSEYMRELIKKDMQGGNDNTVLLEALRMALKQPDVVPMEVKPIMVVDTVVQSVEKQEPAGGTQSNGNLLDQFGWDE